MPMKRLDDFITRQRHEHMGDFEPISQAFTDAYLSRLDMLCSDPDAVGEAISVEAIPGGCWREEWAAHMESLGHDLRAALRDDAAYARIGKRMGEIALDHLCKECERYALAYFEAYIDDFDDNTGGQA